MLRALAHLPDLVRFLSVRLDLALRDLLPLGPPVDPFIGPPLPPGFVFPASADSG